MRSLVRTSGSRPIRHAIVTIFGRESVTASTSGLAPRPQHNAIAKLLSKGTDRTDGCTGPHTTKVQWICAETGRRCPKQNQQG